MTHNRREEMSENIEGNFQEVGNLNQDDFTLQCILCGIDQGLTLTAHRNSIGKVCGFLMACKECQPHLKDFFLVEYGQPKVQAITLEECQARTEAFVKKIESQNPVDELLDGVMLTPSQWQNLKKQEGIEILR